MRLGAVIDGLYPTYVSNTVTQLNADGTFQNRDQNARFQARGVIADGQLEAFVRPTGFSCERQWNLRYVGPVKEGFPFGTDRQRAAGCRTTTITRSRYVVSIETRNDGNWCVVYAQEGSVYPFGSTTITTAPAHGSVEVDDNGISNRIYYRPEAGYVGPDHFSMNLSPNTVPAEVDVTVKP